MSLPTPTQLLRSVRLPPGCSSALGCLGLPLLLWAGAALPRAWKSRPQGKLTACKSNLKKIATALEDYAAKHHNRYPESLEFTAPSTNLPSYSAQKGLEAFPQR